MSLMHIFIHHLKRFFLFSTFYYVKSVNCCFFFVSLSVAVARLKKYFIVVVDFVATVDGVSPTSIIWLCINYAIRLAQETWVMSVGCCCYCCRVYCCCCW